MRAMLRIIVLLWVVVSPVLHAQATGSNDSITAFFGHLIAERAVVSRRADTAAFRRLLDPAAVYLNDDGARESADQHIRNIRKRVDEIASSRWENDSMHVSILGDMALIDYWVVQRRRYGARDLIFTYRSLDAYVRRGGPWLLLRHTETHALAPPTPLTVEASALDEYVGRYEWWPGFFDVVSQRGGKLFLQLTGEAEATSTHAATPESFYFAGDPSLVIFTRDNTGRVMGYVEHEPDGQVIRARKLP